MTVLLPFPDYKLARTIINVANVRSDDRIYNWIDAPAPGPGNERARLPFDETLATREIERAGVRADLSNSLLLLAFAGDSEATADRLGLDLDWDAFAELPRFDAEAVDGLRELVTRWTSAAPA